MPIGPAGDGGDGEQDHQGEEADIDEVEGGLIIEGIGPFEVAGVEACQGGCDAQRDHGAGEEEAEEAELSVPGRAAGGDKVRLPGIERHPCEEGDAVDVEKRARIRPPGKCGGEIGDGEAEEGERQHGERRVGEEAGA